MEMLMHTRELRDLKMRTDSLEQAMKYKDQYLQNVKDVLQGIRL